MLGMGFHEGEKQAIRLSRPSEKGGGSSGQLRPNAQCTFGLPCKGEGQNSDGAPRCVEMKYEETTEKKECNSIRTKTAGYTQIKYCVSGQGCFF